MGTGVLSRGLKRGRGVTLSTHPHLVPGLRMSRSCTSSPPWRLNGVARQFNLLYVTLLKEHRTYLVYINVEYEIHVL
jgi:hypothetical protein